MLKVKDLETTLRWSTMWMLLELLSRIVVPNHNGDIARRLKIVLWL